MSANPPGDTSDGTPGVPRRQWMPVGDAATGANGHRPPRYTRAQVGAEDGQTLTDADQTLTDSDQTLTDADQTSSDSDQTSADCDQLASDRDQAASDHDLQSGVSTHAHDISRDIRQRTARKREQTAQARLAAAARRDAIANTRDLVALARDHAAAARDLAMAQADADHAHDVAGRAITGAEVLMRAAAHRRRAAQLRASAAKQRERAADDRQAAAQDREQAARERSDALADRETLARQLAIAATDVLTGARARAAGLTDLDYELDRCRRTSGPLVVAYVDVVGLKMVNDTEGHGAGDELLKRVVALIQEHLRSYDLIIRLGGDEFLCVMSNMTMPHARRRFNVLTAALAAQPGPGAISVGFAQLAPDDTAPQLIARADSQLIATRRHNTNPPHDDPA